MSLIRFPTFSQDTSGWRPVGLAQTVSFGRAHDPNLSRSGSGFFLYVQVSQSGASIALDVDPTGIPVPHRLSLTAAAWIRVPPSTPEVSGSFALWDLRANVNETAKFVARQTWELITVMLPGPAQGRVRIEFYVNNPGPRLMIDSVNLF